ncbi:hypothetical protein QAD02_023784 [Eretmocerus hayati]|uniref:Uncharacterized protein n=1 Tax=Eretmocerus hayati TaxID=131215 RepID=A0ACC2PXI4_9HYME|nr:hypothetical protein QAD02_023784 [Eretmocerus hayati]
MCLSHVAIVILCFCANVICHDRSHVCHFIYDDKCASKHFEDNIQTNQMKKCNAESIPKEVNFSIMLDEKNSSSHGVITMDFKLPDVLCKHTVALFVNPHIKDIESCRTHKFNESNHSEIHTLEKTICLKQNGESGKNGNKLIDPWPCSEKVLNLWYEYIYTGCYSLGFKNGKEFVFIGNEFLKTEYNKVEVAEPKLRCSYNLSPNQNSNPSVEMVTIAADISVLAGSSGLRLEVAPSPVSRRNEENTCNRYSENPVMKMLIEMSLENAPDSTENNCSLTTTPLSNGDLAKTLECNFVIPHSVKDVGYCFLVFILDERCHKNTSWKPPLKDKIPCAWTQYCMKADNHGHSLNSESVNSDDIKLLLIPRIMYIILFLILIMVTLALMSTVFVAYRIHIQRIKNSLKTSTKKDFEGDVSTVLELRSAKSQEDSKLVRPTGIVIMYVRESDEFMTFMAELKRSIEQHTGCKVYDWWASDLWNEVARLGGYEWVTERIRNDYRIIWVDTLKARNLLTFHRKNCLNKFKKYATSGPGISDFRDSVFPATVDFAKRNNEDIDQEYQRNFVVRLETFENADKTEDPFSDLSPHARYMIPCHLDKLCNILCLEGSYFDNQMLEEKFRLRQHLV